MSNTIAPVLIPTMSRFNKLRRCINSIRKSGLAKKTDLFLAIDFPAKQEHIRGFQKINNYANSVTGFKSVTILKRKENFGAFLNFQSAIDHIFHHFENCIVLEDDNEVSKDFLNYMNAGLEFSKQNKDIFAVCGYMYPCILDKISHDFFLYDGFSAWGFGVWKKKYYNLNLEIKEVEAFLKEPHNKKKITSKHLLANWKHGIRRGYIGFDSMVCFHQLRTSTFSVFPKITRVNNKGFDGSGVHCEKDSIISSELDKQKIFQGTADYSNLKSIKRNNEAKKIIDNYLTKFIWYRKYLRNPSLVFRKVYEIIRLKLDS